MHNNILLYFLFVFEARNLIFLFGVNKVIVLVPECRHGEQ